MAQKLIVTLLQTFVDTWAQNPFLFTVIGLLLILTPILRLPGVKGWFGEMLMRLGFALFLPKDTYRVINNGCVKPTCPAICACLCSWRSSPG
jgi:hypothetical protein